MIALGLDKTCTLYRRSCGQWITPLLDATLYVSRFTLKETREWCAKFLWVPRQPYKNLQTEEKGWRAIYQASNYHLVEPVTVVVPAESCISIKLQYHLINTMNKTALVNKLLPNQPTYWLHTIIQSKMTRIYHFSSFFLVWFWVVTLNEQNRLQQSTRQRGPLGRAGALALWVAGLTREATVSIRRIVYLTGQGQTYTIGTADQRRATGAGINRSVGAGVTTLGTR